jgi:hydrogenase maturation protease
MSQTLVDKIVNAVLYEGYVLYPYRPSVKNTQRWTFGGLYPRSYSEAQAGSDAWWMQTECLVRGSERSTLCVEARFLHLQARVVGEIDPPRPTLEDGDEVPVRTVDALQVGDSIFQTWQEAVERKVDLQPWHLAGDPYVRAFAFAGSRSRELIRNVNDEIAGVVQREQKGIAGLLQLAAEPAGDVMYRVQVRIENRTDLGQAGACTRDLALMRSLASTHIILRVENGEFLSLLDPPDDARVPAAACRNVGMWPVLVGEQGQHDTMLAAPIILYDYPQIAPESPGDLFDATEIDEILSLRIQTLSDDEKRQAAGLDERVRALLARTARLDRAQFAGLHGAMRMLGPQPQQEPT